MSFKKRIPYCIDYERETPSEVYKVRIYRPVCPGLFPHAVNQDNCELCREKMDFALWTQQQGRILRPRAERVALSRRFKIAVTRLINWIGSWSKN